MVLVIVNKMNGSEISPAELINIFYFVYDIIKHVIEEFLKATLYNANPELAKSYADAISMLIPITALWILLELVENVKKIVRIIVILGWVLLMLSILVSFWV